MQPNWPFSLRYFGAFRRNDFQLFVLPHSHAIMRAFPALP